MRVPDILAVQLLCRTAVDLSGVIVQLAVITGYKNPYHILFPYTDESGTATLTAADFIGQFEDHWESGLMDYQGTVSDARSIVEVGLFNPSWLRAHRLEALAWPLLRNERGKWRSRSDQYEYLCRCRNELFVAEPITVNLEDQARFRLSVATAQGAV